MRCHTDAPVAAPPGRPLIEVADVFRAHGEAYRQSHALSGDQLKVMRAIEQCRTVALGGHLDVCPACDFQRPAYNSCRNRHCPKCQSLAQARWIQQRLERVLPTHHFHVVFTMPAELRTLCHANREELFKLLFASASRTLLEIGDDPERLGARLGITAVLHTWTRKLTFHPHLHCIVTGGGLAPSGDEWIASNPRYFFPVHVLGALFRGKLLAGLRRLRDHGALRYTGRAAPLAEDNTFDRLLDRLYQTSWVVYAKRPFAGPEHVFRYLGRYTHRVGISNHRIQAFDDTGVRFATKDGKSVTLAPAEFIRRYLQHVLPRGFNKIRHFGIYAATNINTKLELARELLTPDAIDAGEQQQSDVAQDSTHDDIAVTWAELILQLTGIDPRLCPSCGCALIQKPLPQPPPSYTDTS